MLKFFGLTVMVGVIAVACFWYTAPEFTRSTALRMVEYVVSQTNIDKADKSSITVKLVSRAEQLLGGAMPMDELAAISAAQADANFSTKVTHAFFGEDDVNSGETSPSKRVSSYDTHRSDATYAPIDTGADIQSNPFLK